MVTSRELVNNTLQLRNNSRVPRELWTLPWAGMNYQNELEKIRHDFPDDIASVPGFCKSSPKIKGEQYEIGEYVDEWGCIFTNRQRGVIGEIKKPVILDEDWEDAERFEFPEELVHIDKGRINEYCRNSDKFVLPAEYARPFERLQFIRGTEQLYVDLMYRPLKMFEFIEKLHDFNCRMLEAWGETEVDALTIMDDWGSQNGLLINPELWVEIFKPLYRDYIEIAHKHGKKTFMHSDGNILAIIPHLIDIGLDALNSQIFCMGLGNLKQFKGKICFWGEIDRQWLLPRGTEQEIEEAVKQVKESLWENGGCIAQCEFSIGTNPRNVYKVFETWNKLA